MTQRETRLVRFAAIGIAIYLTLFFGYQGWKYCSAKRAEYKQLVAEARALKEEVKSYDAKIGVVKKLMEDYHMDPAKLNKATIVADASAAIQQAAAGGGFAIGPIRETATRTSNKELGSIQFEGSGQVKAATALLQRLKTLGYPLVIDSAAFTMDPTRPGSLKLKLNVVVLDFDQWKKVEAPHA